MSMRGRRRYGECHKNHACAIGGKARDGCGEFVAGSGTNALHCAACGCHRSFHRPPSPQSETKQKKQQQEEEEEEEEQQQQQPQPQPQPQQQPQQQPQPQPQPQQQQQQPEATFQPAPTTVLLALPAFPNYISVARRRRVPQSPIPQPQPQPSPPPSRFVPMDMEVERTPRTRTRARYNEEQKARMRDFADMSGWQMRRENEEALLRMCTEIGVPRQMFKVWMHNNKAKYAVQVGTSVTASATAPPPAE